ncbi:MAG: class D sortase [Fastidiosipilaceae bacterium]
MATQNKPTPRRAKKSKQKNKWIDVLLILIIIASLSSGLYLLIQPKIVQNNQDKVTADLNLVVDGQLNQPIMVDPRANKVPGEDYDFFGDDDQDDINYEDLPDLVELIPLGRLKIPDINVDLPILEGATHVQLRYGLAHIESSSLPGEEGNCAILGHRMLDNGRHLNRLNEVEIGDLITINTGTDLYTYEVFDMPVVRPEDLLSYVEKDYSGSTITLSTCHPIPTWTHRLLCVAKQVEHQTIE